MFFVLQSTPGLICCQDQKETQKFNNTLTNIRWIVYSIGKLVGCIGISYMHYIVSALSTLGLTETLSSCSNTLFRLVHTFATIELSAVMQGYIYTVIYGVTSWKNTTS